jgi:hypothetical protein
MKKLPGTVHGEMKKLGKKITKMKIEKIERINCIYLILVPKIVWKRGLYFQARESGPA